MNKTRRISNVPNYIIGTIAALRTTKAQNANDIANVTGYETAADNIGVREYYWDATSTEADNGGTIIQVTGVVTGRWKMKQEGDINPKWFGAKGDGVTDDSASFVLTAGGTYDLGGLAYVIGSKTIPLCTIKNGTIKLTANSRLSISDGATFENITIDCQNLPVNVSALYVYGGNFTFHNSAIKNINSATPMSAQYGIIIKPQGGVKFSIRDSLFLNITNTDDGTPAGSGFCGGVFFFGDAVSLTEYEATPSNGIIDHCTFENIYTQTGVGATIDNTDADAIRFYIDGLTEAFDVIFPITVSNCRFKDVQKSCFKINGGNGMTIENINIDAKRADFTMLAAIRIQYAYDCVIENVTLDGNATYLFALSTKRCQITNTNTTSSSNVTQGIFIQDSGIVSSGIIVDGGAWNQVSRLVGTNYTTGTSVENMKIANIVANHTTPNNPYVYIPYSLNVTLDNITFATTSAVDVCQVSETSGMKIKNCNFKSGRRSIAMDANSQQNLNLTIQGCTLETTGVGIGHRLITLRATTGTALTPTGISIKDCNLKRYSFTSSTNDEFMLIQGNIVSIDNIQMYVEQLSTNTFASAYAINLLSSTKVNLTNIFYTCNFAYNASWAGWVAILNACTFATVYNIHGGCRRGVEFSNTSNCHYNNIAAVVSNTITTVTGGTNITAGTDLVAVL